MPEQTPMKFVVLIAVEGQDYTYRVDSEHLDNPDAAIARMMEIYKEGRRTFVEPCPAGWRLPRAYKVVE